jgi:hypothetical protein
MEDDGEQLQNAAREEFIINLALAVLLRRRRERRRRRQRQIKTVWVRPWILRRTMYGQYETLLQELHREDVRSFKNFLRIPPELFAEMVDRLRPIIEKKDTFWRKALEPGLRLAVCLRYMATEKRS